MEHRIKSSLIIGKSLSTEEYLPETSVTHDGLLRTAKKGICKSKVMSWHKNIGLKILEQKKKVRRRKTHTCS